MYLSGMKEQHHGNTYGKNWAIQLLYLFLSNDALLAGDISDSSAGSGYNGCDYDGDLVVASGAAFLFERLESNCLY
jgi:hypothetical protein